MIKRLAQYLALLVICLTLHVAPAMAKGNSAALAEIAPVVHDYPSIQGATMGTIGPQDAEPITMINGVMTAGTVRVNNLANLEAALNIFANAMEIIWLAFAIYMLHKTIKINTKKPAKVMMGLANSAAFAAIGLLTPNVINYAVMYARDAALFN